MSLARPKNKDLVEIFGYAPDDLTPSVRSLWNLGECPFINKSCSKSNHDSSVVYGTCSVTTTFGDCIICPNRLYEKNYATLRTIAKDAFGDVAEFILFDEYIKRRNECGVFVVALGQNSGKEVKIGRSLSMDWVLAKIENNQLIEYVGVTSSIVPAPPQIRLNTSVPLVPPKPKPFDIATSIFFSRAVCGT